MGARYRPGESVVAEPTWARVLVWIGFPLLGAAGGWLLKVAAGWIASWPWGPFRGPFLLVAAVDEPHATVGALAVGGLAGLVVAYLTALDRLTVTVAGDQVTLARGGTVRSAERRLGDAVFMDGKQLVLLGTAGDELAREGSDLDAERLTDAFRTHGYPWRVDGDPFADRYRRWVEDEPELAAGANGDDAAELRAELAKLGVVVRDQRKRQYWRRTGR